MKRAEIEANLRALGEKLAARGVTGEILIVGGAYMLLVLRNREATRDIDAYFDKDRDAIREAVAEVARERALPGDWLNDAVKGFMRTKPRRTDLWASYPGLNLYVPDPEYIFAMKAEAARVGTSDIDDLKALIKKLKIADVQAALTVVERYVPSGLRSMRTQLTLEAIFEDLAPARRRRTMAWSDVTMASTKAAKTHIIRPGTRLTFCGREIPARSTRGPARSDDPRAALGHRLCHTCHASWKAATA
jgi:hypothetical protein